MRAFKHISFVFLLLAAGNSFAQFSKLEKALELYRDKQIDSAKVYIDAAAMHSETKNDYNVWMVKGFIYKDLYKIREGDKPTSMLRDIAVESFRKSLTLDTTSKNPQKEGILKGMKYLASTYHNDIVKTLDTVRYQTSLDNAASYLAITKFLDPSFNEKNYNYEIFLTLGSMFEAEYQTAKGKTVMDLAKVYLFKAHDIDSSTFLVNKNLGLLYYNQAVEIINKMDVETPLEQIPIEQDKAIKLGKQALSYCLKAHKLKPTDKVVVEALMGIYYLLNENELHNHYKKIWEELNKPQ